VTPTHRPSCISNCTARAAQHAPAALDQAAFERAQQHVAAAAFPIQARPGTARRRNHPLLMRCVAGLDEADAFLLQPAHAARRIRGNRFGQVAAGKPFGHRLDDVHQLRAVGHDVLHADMQRSAGETRIAQVFLGRALLQDGGAKPGLRGAVRGGQAGDAAADHDDVPPGIP